MSDPGRGLRFGTAADLYDRRRPSYPQAAVDHIVDTADPAPADMVEVGCGTGKATVLFAAKGLRITAVEPDADMAAVARRNVPDAAVLVSRFEDWDGPDAGADLVVSAQAWHWTDRAVSVPQAVRVLRPGGRVAIMANIPRDGGLDLRDRLDPVYERIVPEQYGEIGMIDWTGQFDDFAADFAAAGLAVEPRWHADWDQPLSAADFADLHRTHSTFIALDAARRDRLCEELAAAVEEAGGTVTMLYRTVVLLARKPGTP